MDSVVARYDPSAGETTWREPELSATDRAAIALRQVIYGRLDALLFTIDLLAEVRHDPETGRFMPGPREDRGKGGKSKGDALGKGKASDAAREASKRVAQVEKEGDPKTAAQANRDAADAHRKAEKSARSEQVKSAHREAAKIHDERAAAHEAKDKGEKEAKPPKSAEKPAKSKPEKAPKSSGVKPGSYAKHLEKSGVKDYAIDIDKAHVKAIFGDKAPDAKDLNAAWGANGAHGLTSKIVGVHSSRMGITPEIMYTSHIHDAAGNKVGYSQRKFSRDREGKLVVKHENFFIDKADAQGKGFGAAVTKSSIQAYEKMGVDRVRTDAAEVGRYTWPSLGFGWSKEQGDAIKPKLSEYLVSRGVVKSVADAVAEKHGGIAWEVASLHFGDEHVGKGFLMAQPVIQGLTLNLNHDSPSYRHAKERLGL